MKYFLIITVAGTRLATIGDYCTTSSSVANDGLDNDCDGLIDEELLDGLDDDGDGRIGNLLAARHSRAARATNSVKFFYLSSAHCLFCRTFHHENAGKISRSCFNSLTDACALMAV